MLVNYKYDRRNNCIEERYLSNMVTFITDIEGEGDPKDTVLFITHTGK